MLRCLFVFVVCLLVTSAPKSIRAENPVCLVITGVSVSGNICASDNTGRVLNGPEWRQVITALPNGDDCSDLQRSVPIVLVKGSTVDITYTFYRPRNTGTYTGTVSPGSVRYAGQQITTSTASQNISVSAGSAATFTFTAGPFPNMVKHRHPLKIALNFSPTVTVHSQILPFSSEEQAFDDTGGYGGDPSAGFPMYLVYATPKAPQVNPWIGVLQDAYGWASGCTSESSVATSCTDGLYGWPFSLSERFFYTNVEGYPSSYSTTSSTVHSYPRDIFDLKKFLVDTEFGFPTAGNCHDVSNYLCICMNAIGVQSSIMYAKKNTASLDTFVNFNTNELFPIGYGLSSTYTWNNHQMVQGPSASFLAVYDACLALRDDPVQGPAVGIDFNLYWQNPTVPTNCLVASPANFLPHISFSPVLIRP